MPRQLPTRTRRRLTPPRVAIPAAALLTVVLGLAGCAVAAPSPSATPTATAASPTSDASPTPSAPTGPTFIADGSATDNLPLFTAVTAGVWASEQRAAGRAYVDALVAAGFDKAAMQVTNDQSTVGNAAESILFAVRWGDECLVGQVGPATGEPFTTVIDVTAEGTCLIGSTRPIDW